MFLKVQRNSPRAFPHRALLSAALLWLLALPAVSPAQELARRLILKDGSYQLVTKYEVKGDRVRYLSAERDDWEELPSSLIDWPATEKYERDRAAGAAVPEAAQLDKEIELERDRAEALLPEVAPGLRLPDDSGVFLLDSFQGEPQIVELQQTAGEVSHHTKGNIFRDAMNPVAGLKVAIELEGAHAPLQAHVEVPSIYIKMDAAPDASDRASPKSSNSSSPSTLQPQQATLPFDGFRLVRTEVKSGKRVVGDVKRQPTGKIVQDQHLVKTTVTRVTGGWLKLTPTESLPPGEYVLIEMTGQQDGNGKEGINLFVWDFGVNPKAPANQNPWKPDAPGPKPESDSKPN
jgi:hypothetical protein